MKIGINGRFLTEPHTGIGTYTYNLLQALGKIDKRNTYLIATPARPKRRIRLPKNFKIHVIREKPLGISGIKKLHWERSQITRFFKKNDISLIHHMYPVPLKKLKTPQIVTVHDIIPWIMPEYNRKLKSSIYLGMIARTLKRAARIIAVSKETQKDVSSYFKIQKTHIEITHLAPAEIFGKKSAARGPLHSPSHGDKPFILYAGGYDERKNVNTLVEAFQEKIAPHFEIDLILIGGKVRESELYKSFENASILQGQTIRDNMKHRIKNKGKIHFTGFVDEEELAAWYRKCTVFCHLSRKEGFNLPLIEAAASGAAIVASDIPVHREVMKGAALYVDPDNRDAIAAQLLAFVTDYELRETYKKKSQNRAKKFDWGKTAQKTIDIYKSTCSL